MGKIKYILILLMIPGILGSCEKMFMGSDPENTPQNNFSILWKTLDENYPLFEVKKLNWDSLYNVYNSRFTVHSTEEDLWKISGELILNLDDGHVNIFNQDYSKQLNSSKLQNSNKPNDFSLETVRKTYLKYSQNIGSGNITYGMIKNPNRDIGYIHVASFSYNNSYENWAYAIDSALNDVAGYDALILDIRNNGGGTLTNVNIILSAFIEHDFTYFYYRYKTGPAHDAFGNLLPVSVSARRGIIPFKKNIVLLTNRFTGSGGEYLAQAFKNIPNAQQVGDTTFGAFGEVVNIAQLPNGWTFRYPCTITSTPEGKCLEGIGVIPEIYKVNSSYDFFTGRDRVIEFVVSNLLK